MNCDLDLFTGFFNSTIIWFPLRILSEKTELVDESELDKDAMQKLLLRLLALVNLIHPYIENDLLMAVEMGKLICWFVSTNG